MSEPVGSGLRNFRYRAQRHPAHENRISHGVPHRLRGQLRVSLADRNELSNGRVRVAQRRLRHLQARVSLIRFHSDVPFVNRRRGQRLRDLLCEQSSPGVGTDDPIDFKSTIALELANYAVGLFAEDPVDLEHVTTLPQKLLHRDH